MTSHALVRDVIAEGQSRLRVGLLKPMSFRDDSGFRHPFEIPDKDERRDWACVSSS